MNLKYILPLLFTACCSTAAAAPAVHPAEKPNLTVVCDPGGTLHFDPPEIRTADLTATVPHHAYAKWFEPWQPWPKGQDRKTTTIDLSPNRDEKGILILGGLYRSFQIDTLKVTSADGSKTFKQDRDFKFNADWGQIAALDGKLGEPGTAEVKVSCQYALQRIDLIQAMPNGKLDVKKGESVLVCPQRPEPDAGATALAGIYIAPWRVANNPHFGGDTAPPTFTEYAITKHEIFSIQPAPPVALLNPDAVSQTLKKLRAGQPVSIALMGDSISTGAEAGAWWSNKFTEKDLTYRGRFIMGLRSRFPQSEITPVEAYKGGAGMPFAIGVFKKTVQPAKPNLVVIAFGANDASGGVGKGPKNPPESFREQMISLVRQAKTLGSEVVLVMGMQMNPWHPNEAAKRQPEYLKVLQEIARSEQVALADVYTEWLNLASHGIPPFSQLHNWVNHPGILGHKVYADTLLRFFPKDKEL